MESFKVMKSIEKNFLFFLMIIIDLNVIMRLTNQNSLLVGHRKIFDLVSFKFHLKLALFLFKRVVGHGKPWLNSKIFLRSEFGFENLIFLRSRVILMFIFHCNFTHVYFFLLVNILQNTRIVAFSTIFSDFNIQAI